jgi:hypothetical protein
MIDFLSEYELSNKYKHKGYTPHLVRDICEQENCKNGVDVMPTTTSSSGRSGR